MSNKMQSMQEDWDYKKFLEIFYRISGTKKIYSIDDATTASILAFQYKNDPIAYTNVEQFSKTVIKAMSIQEKWDEKKFIDTYNEVAKRNRGHNYDNRDFMDILKKQYTLDPLSYPHIQIFAEIKFESQQLYS